MAGPLRHYEHYTDPGRGSFMERVSEAVASGMGTVQFVVVSSVLIGAWVLVNHGIRFLAHSIRGLETGAGFDPAPFILLNLVFSAVAFYTGALVIIAQKAQSRTDKANALAAAKHREELDAANKELLEQNTELTRRVHELTEQVYALVSPTTDPKPEVKRKAPARKTAKPAAGRSASKNSKTGG